MSAAAPRLPARRHPTVAAVLDRPSLLRALAARWGSPLHVVLPGVMSQNITAFEAVLARAGARSRIFFAHKANQAPAFVSAARAAGIGIDVASTGELRSAAAAGFGGDRIEVTGPKGRAFLEEVVAAGAVVNVDNVWELDQVVALARARRPAGDRVAVLVRTTGGGGGAGGAGGAGRLSRFGVPTAEWDAVISRLVGARDAVTFLGPSFHLDTGEIAEKVRAVEQSLALVEHAARAGLAPTVLNIGGGFRQAFVDDATSFDAYVAHLRRGLLGQGPALTWDGATLGYRVENRTVRGIPEFHKYAGSRTGWQHLTDLLSAPLPAHDGQPLAEVLRDTLLDLWLEPGKGLVDHAGLTLATVEFVARGSGDDPLVVLDLSRDKICPADQEVLLDPLVIGDPREGWPAGRPGGPVGVFFAGNLCLERDLVLRHRVFLDRLPEPGDLVVFVNTAGYQMDLSASDALMQRRPGRVALTVEPSGRCTARADSRGSVAPDEEMVWPSTTT